MTEQLKELAGFLARTQAIFFAPGLKLKDGRPTPYFINLGRLNTGRTGLELAGHMARILVDEGLVRGGEVLAGPSYKGSALAALTAAALWTGHRIEVGFDYDRKEAKDHGEASAARTVFVTGALKSASEAVVIDDVATSMATKIQLVKKLRAEYPHLNIKAVIVGVDREQTGPVHDADGRLRLGIKGPDPVGAFTKETGLKVLAAAPVRQVVETLFRSRIPVLVEGKMRPLGEKEVREFEEYMAIYGRDA